MFLCDRRHLYQVEFILHLRVLVCALCVSSVCLVRVGVFQLGSAFEAEFERMSDDITEARFNAIQHRIQLAQVEMVPSHCFISFCRVELFWSSVVALLSIPLYTALLRPMVELLLRAGESSTS